MPHSWSGWGDSASWNTLSVNCQSFSTIVRRASLIAEQSGELPTLDYQHQGPFLKVTPETSSGMVWRTLCQETAMITGGTLLDDFCDWPKEQSLHVLPRANVKTKRKPRDRWIRPWRSHGGHPPTVLKRKRIPHNILIGCKYMNADICFSYYTQEENT